MKVPKYIREKMHRIALHARMVSDLDREVGIWLEQNGIDVEKLSDGGGSGYEPEEIKTVEKALGVLKMYEDANIPAEACAEYRKFEDELIRDGMSLQHVLDLLEAEKEGRLKVRPESLGQCCGQCHHFLRGPMKASGICEVRKNKHYPRAGTPLYCCQSKKACLDFDERGERPIRYQEA